jgi:hypothetical protein
VAHIGPLAASVSDAALALAAIGGRDARDRCSLAQPSRLSALHTMQRFATGGRDRGVGDLSDLRVGVDVDWFSHADAELVAACRAVVCALTAALSGSGALKSSSSSKQTHESHDFWTPSFSSSSDSAAAGVSAASAAADAMFDSLIDRTALAQCRHRSLQSRGGSNCSNCSNSSNDHGAAQLVRVRVGHLDLYRLAHTATILAEMQTAVSHTRAAHNGALNASTRVALAAASGLTAQHYVKAQVIAQQPSRAALVPALSHSTCVSIVFMRCVTFTHSLPF